MADAVILPVLTQRLFHYAAVVTDVHDGDTITVSIDLGLKTWVHEIKLRFARIDAPELSTDAGVISATYLKILVLNKEIIVNTVRDKTEKYGRYLAEVYVGGENINDAMVKSGNAVYREY